MIIDTETFEDLALTLKVQSDFVVLMAAYLSREPEVSPVLHHYATEINKNVGTMVKILNAVHEENKAIAPPTGTIGRA